MRDFSVPAKIVFFSTCLNHHQAPLADELFGRLGEGFCFVELSCCLDKKGSAEDFSGRPYLIRPWESEAAQKLASDLSITAECCVFSSVYSIPYMKERLKRGLLSFDMGERWLKKGVVNVFSPAILKMTLSYFLYGWKKKPLYRLCMSAFAAEDHRRLGMYAGKCYEWGYFTRQVKSLEHCREDFNGGCSHSDVRMLWCSRFLKWKHPELSIFLAARLKSRGCHFHIDLYGSGEEENRIRSLAARQNVLDVVTFHGMVDNEEIHAAMKNADIFLFTSDRNEGWGAVANESMSEGCVLVGASDIGSVPYLVRDGYNGLVFRGPSAKSSCKHPDKKSLDSLEKKVVWLLEHPAKRVEMQRMARSQMRDVWSSGNAATSLLALVEDLGLGNESRCKDGPCSRA